MLLLVPHAVEECASELPKTPAPGEGVERSRVRIAHVCTAGAALGVRPRTTA